MRQTLGVIMLLFMCISCVNSKNTNIQLVKDLPSLKAAIASAQAGSEIVMADGIWTNADIELYGIGTDSQPITLRAETPGKVFLEGQSYLHLGGEYLVVEGLFFRNGYSPGSGVIRFKIGKDSTAFHSRVSQTVIKDYTQPNRWEKDRWVEMYGQHNTFDHNYLSGKSNDGATFLVYHNGNENTNSYHQIVNNYFGPRPRKGGPRGETMRLGGSETSMTPGKVMVANNFFDRCNGEVEIISDKTNFNHYVNNIFYKCEGSLVMRHSDYTTVDGNMFIGDDDSDFYGGIRVINSGHWITNNYFYKIKGEEFRSPLAVMNGIPKSSLNRYKQVTDVVVAHNTWVDCAAPWQIGVGQNIASASVLPKSEIRSAPPIRTVLANNIIYNTKTDPTPIVNHDDINGVKFENNIISNAGNTSDEFDAFQHENLVMNQINDWLFVPESKGNEFLSTLYNGFGFDRIKKDLLGNSRASLNRVGALADVNSAAGFTIDKQNYGPDWFSPDPAPRKAVVHQVSATPGALQEAIDKAEAGDIISLMDQNYTQTTPLAINKSIIIRASEEVETTITYEGKAGTAAFEMHPKGSLELMGVTLQGNGSQMAFAPLKENMASSYKLKVKESVVQNFDHILLASRGSFADSISIDNTSFRNSKNGFVLAADVKGDYNAEMFTITNSSFENIDQNVIHFYRGGYDESTIGGVLTLQNNEFTRSGAKEKSGILIKTRGIINVSLEDNNFRNNKVKRVAILWGAKNNHHKGNTISRSGKIEVQEQQALELLY